MTNYDKALYESSILFLYIIRKGLTDDLIKFIVEEEGHKALFLFMSIYEENKKYITKYIKEWEKE